MHNKSSNQPHTQSANPLHSQSSNQQTQTNDPFGFTQFSQYYLDQINHFSKLSQSFINNSGENINPIETNMKIWQESMGFLSDLFIPNSVKTPNEQDQSNKEGNNQKSHSKDDNSVDKPHADQPHPDNELITTVLEGFSELSQKFLHETLKRLTTKSDTSQALLFDALDEWQKFTVTVLEKSPVTLLEQQTILWQQQLQLYQNTLMNMAGATTEPLISPDKGDKRFKDEEWTNQPLFDYLKQSYLLTVDSMMDTIDTAEDIDEKTRQRLSFFTRQWLNAVAPTNFLWSNPEILRLTQETGGKNLLDGLKQLAEDMEKSAHMLNISMTDSDAFKLGENIATTPGKIVFRNSMFELIQYTPITAKVNKRPLVIVPPWINKFYIMDLKEKNSFILWALEQGQSVFIISWVNPTTAYKEVGMETYMHKGLLTALDVVKDITGEPDANVIGYCIGGLLLALTLSWLAENNQDKRIASATFWTTMFDFSDPGDLGVFIDDRIVTALEDEGAKKGVFDGRMMGVAFSLLRENSLYWNYYVQNYLKGERPTPFDLLYWNSDCTNVTAELHRFILRELYLGNKLKQKGKLDFDGIKIDLSKVTTPTYVVATLQDHIVKWRGSYESTQLFGGDVTFVLGESGHVAGIINPPTGKYGFYTRDTYDDNADDWFSKAEKHDNSWWLHWGDWVKQYSAGDVAQRQPGINYKGENWDILCDAPGEYVRVRADEALDV